MDSRPTDHIADAANESSQFKSSDIYKIQYILHMKSYQFLLFCRMPTSPIARLNKGSLCNLDLSPCLRFACRFLIPSLKTLLLSSTESLDFRATKALSMISCVSLPATTLIADCIFESSSKVVSPLNSSPLFGFRISSLLLALCSSSAGTSSGIVSSFSPFLINETVFCVMLHEIRSVSLKPPKASGCFRCCSTHLDLLMFANHESQYGRFGILIVFILLRRQCFDVFHLNSLILSSIYRFSCLGVNRFLTDWKCHDSLFLSTVTKDLVLKSKEVCHALLRNAIIDTC